MDTVCGIDIRWVNVVGLAFDIAGAFVLAYGLMISRRKAVELGRSSWPGLGAPHEPPTQENLAMNLRLPPVQDRLAQSRNAIIGFGLLFIGFALQIVGNWPR